MGYPMTELQSVTCHQESHSVTCHPTQVNAPRLNPSQPCRPTLDLPTPEDGRLSRPRLALQLCCLHDASVRCLPFHITELLGLPNIQ